MMGIFRKKTKQKPVEAIKARTEVEAGLEENHRLAAEANRIAKRLSESRKANHYAERIRSAYQIEQR